MTTRTTAKGGAPRSVVITVEGLAAALELELNRTHPAGRYDELAAAIFAALPAEPAGARCNCPESGTSGSCPFHDASTLAEPAGAGLREALDWLRTADRLLQRRIEMPGAGLTWSKDVDAFLARRPPALAATPVGEEEG